MDTFNVFITLIITVATILAYVVYTRYKLFRTFKTLGFPGPEPNFITGNASELNYGSEGPAIAMEKWRKKYGNFFGYYADTLPVLVISDVDVINHITNKDFQHFTDRFSKNVGFNFPVLGKSLVFEKGSSWKHIRKTLTPAFSGSKLKQLTPIMNRAVEDFVKNLSKVSSNGKKFDIYDRFGRLTLDVIGESALAMKINCQEVEGSKLYEDIQKIMKSGRKVSSAFMYSVTYFPELMILLKFVTLRTALGKSVMELVRNLKTAIRTRRGQSMVKTVDMLQLMLEAEAKEQAIKTKPLTDEQLIGNCFVFVLAGFETTATTLGYLAYLLSRHPDVQDKVYKEIQENVKDVMNVTYEDTNNLPYLRQVINETLRLYPPVWITARVNNEEYIFDGKKLPAETRIEFPIYSIHRNPELWPEPDKFDPERFSPENKVKIHPAAFIPFGNGPRQCIGMRFSLLEVKLAIIQLLREYRLAPLENYVLERFIPGATYVPKNGVFVKVESRLA